MGNKISIIVPIYNVEQYLRKCIDSLIKQTFTNIQIILVDDGATDSCPEICDEYAKKDNRIKVIHKQNGGLSDARNAGMRAASGDYIAFIDSDDYVSGRMFEVLINIMLERNCDIVECDALKVYGNKEDVDENICNLGSITEYNNEKALNTLMLEENLTQTVWNKLYKADLIKDIYFEIGKINEDEFWTYQVFGKAQKIVKINAPLYYYLQRQGSIMNGEYNIKRLDCLEALYMRMNYINKNFPRLSLIAKRSYINTCFYHYQCICRNQEKDKEKVYRKAILEKLKLTDKWGIEKQLKLKQTIWILLFFLMPDSVCNIRNKLKIGV
jgi:glycosyltransferase involved in cell wall biosynthesis